MSEPPPWMIHGCISVEIVSISQFVAFLLVKAISLSSRLDVATVVSPL
jgi:hypothetical protein